jgi:epoxyqueuosine reductase
LTDKDIKPGINKEASALGFDICRITQAQLPEQVGQRLSQAIAFDYHADMEWLAQTMPRRSNPPAMWDEAQSAIILGMNYGPQGDPLENLAWRDRASISVYARHRDYHDVIKGRLKQIAQYVAKQTGAAVKVFVDTAPLAEKPLAEQAGIGWQGKHTNLVSRQFGSWLFLGVILTSARLEPDIPESDHCGTCRACLDICPTDAFPAPYQLDARRCISYLTIEHKGPIPHEFRAAMGNRIYGCDDCLAVCPWNKFAAHAREAKLQARSDLVSPELGSLCELDDEGFRRMFSGSPIKRIGRGRFVRNVLIAIGNSGMVSLALKARTRLDDSDPVVRGAAVWALSQLVDKEVLVQQWANRKTDETSREVIDEWEQALNDGC